MLTLCYYLWRINGGKQKTHQLIIHYTRLLSRLWLTTYIVDSWQMAGHYCKKDNRVLTSSFQIYSTRFLFGEYLFLKTDISLLSTLTISKNPFWKPAASFSPAQPSVRCSKNLSQEREWLIGVDWLENRPHIVQS